jgi:multidrug efflux pump subunit AcrB
VVFEGETQEAETTQASMLHGAILGLIGVFILLSFQFRSYVEPLMVMAVIPLALIGVVLGHVLMRLDLTMPSMLGFASLAGIVVNDSILLVLFLKMQRSAGMPTLRAAGQASRQRFRAVLITSATTIAGLLPLTLERSLQAQILIPLAVSIVFGLLASTVLVLSVVPCVYMVLHDLGLTARIVEEGDQEV